VADKLENSTLNKMVKQILKAEKAPAAADKKHGRSNSITGSSKQTFKQFYKDIQGVPDVPHAKAKRNPSGTTKILSHNPSISHLTSHQNSPNRGTATATGINIYNTSTAQWTSSFQEY